MDYEVEYEGIVVRLKSPNVDTLDYLQSAGDVVGDLSKPIKVRLKKMYDVIDKFSTEPIKDTIGTFDTADPNVINILYFKIIKEYHKPLNDYLADDAASQLNNASFNEVTELLKSLPNLANLQKVKYHK